MPLPLPRLRIRTRIALWITFISIALFVFMAVGVYIVFQRQLLANLDDTLSLRAASNQQLVDLSTSPPTLGISHDPNPELFSGEAVLRLYRGDGTLLEDASPATGLSDQERN